MSHVEAFQLMPSTKIVVSIDHYNCCYDGYDVDQNKGKLMSLLYLKPPVASYFPKEDSTKTLPAAKHSSHAMPLGTCWTCPMCSCCLPAQNVLTFSEREREAAQSRSWEDSSVDKVTTIQV